MKKLDLAAALFTLAAVPALANNFPVPSFNDAPDLYTTHSNSGEPRAAAGGREGAPAPSARQGASRSRQEQHNNAVVPFGPSVTPSSG